jgi:hypothetical protein
VVKSGTDGRREGWKQGRDETGSGEGWKGKVEGWVKVSPSNLPIPFFQVV